MGDEKRRRHANIGPAFTRSIAFAAWLALACGSRGNDYTMAAVALGGTALATAGSRVATGNCVATCSPGHVCDRRSGFCVRGECAPGCPVGQHCVLEATGDFACVNDFGTVRMNNAPTARPSGVSVADAGAPPPRDAGAALADAGAALADAGAAGAGPNPQ